MSVTFTKLFSSITESTVWLLPDSARLVWITMLAMADRKGRVYGSVPGLAHRARVETEPCRAALEIFRAPDPDSRSKEFEGRRIEDLPEGGGWQILTYAKHRAIRDQETIKESKRNYASKMRKSKKVSTVDREGIGVERSRPLSIQAEAEAEAELFRDSSSVGVPSGDDRVSNARTRGRPENPEEVFAYFAEQEALRSWAIEFLAYYESNGWRVGRNPMKNWKAAAAGWITRNEERGSR